MVYIWRSMPASLTFHPLTPDRWSDFVELFGPRGACGGCWCMFWKLSAREFNSLAHEGTKAAQHALVRSGTVPGLMAYAGDQAVGWIAVEPRSQYPRLAHSRILKPVDDAPVWSITCFFTRKDYRRRGVTLALLKAAIQHVKRQGGGIVEGYPIDAGGEDLPAVFVYTGLASAFQKAGFKEVGRNSKKRPILRYVIGK